MFYTLIPSAYHALTSKTWAFWHEASKNIAKRAVFVYAAHALANEARALWHKTRKRRTKRAAFANNARALASKTRAFWWEGHRRLRCVKDVGVALK